MWYHSIFLVYGEKKVATLVATLFFSHCVLILPSFLSPPPRVPFVHSFFFLMAMAMAMVMEILKLNLNLAAAVASIVGAAELYVRTGSTISLTCIIQGSGTIPPRILFWFHNSRPSKKDGRLNIITFFFFCFLLLLILLILLLLCPAVEWFTMYVDLLCLLFDAHSCFGLATRRHFARNGTNNGWNVVQTAAHTRHPTRRRFIIILLLLLLISIIITRLLLLSCCYCCFCIVVFFKWANFISISFCLCLSQI